MARSRKQYGRRRYGSRTITKRKRRFRRRGLRPRIRRIWSFMRNKGLRNIETKYIQGTHTSSPAAGSQTRVTILSNGPGISAKFFFTDIDQGPAKYERIGQKVFIKAIKFRLYLQAPPSTGEGAPAFVPQENHIRVILVREKTALGTQIGNDSPTLYHFMNNNLATDAQDPEIAVAGDSRLQFISLFKYYDSKFADNYTVLFDRTFKVANEQGGDRYYQAKKYVLQIKQPCHWDSTGLRGDGHIYGFYFTDITSNPETSGFIPQLFMSYRTTYTDI